MLILLWIIFVIIGIVITIKDDKYDPISPPYWIVGAMVTIVIITLCLFGYPYKISDKLVMYEEENIKIEEKVKSTVQGYMNYESDTYKNLIENADLETLLVKYPELNSNELVKSEVELYKENSRKIKELREQKITKSIWDWWLKFNIGEEE